MVAACGSRYRHCGTHMVGPVPVITDCGAMEYRIAPCSVELYEAVVAVNDQFGQERDCWSPFRSEWPARPAGQEVACRL